MYLHWAKLVIHGMILFMHSESSLSKLNDISISPVVVGDLGSMALITHRANAMRDNQPLPDQTDPGIIDDMQDRFNRSAMWAYGGKDNDRLAGFVLGYPTSEQASVDTDPSVEY